jgi:CheY-like chemotaxis protein
MNDAKKILVVEDDDVTRELMRMTLERKGYVVVTAEDGLRGYDAAVSVRPDLIITDVNMPAADGVHLVRRVRNTPDIAEIPVIVTTGYGTGNASLTLSQGATAYEPKPIDPASVLATIKRLLSDNGR